MLKFRCLWRVVPILFIGTNRLPKNCIAVSLGLVVLIRNSHIGDLPTTAHELEHCKQSLKGLGFIHLFRYHFSTPYRLRSEAAAFAAEIECYDSHEVTHRTAEVVESLVHCYRLNSSPIVARDAIQVALNKNKA